MQVKKRAFVCTCRYRSDLYEENLQALLQCVSLARQIDQPFPMSQMKLTALVPGNIIVSTLTSILGITPYYDNLEALAKYVSIARQIRDQPFQVA